MNERRDLACRMLYEANHRLNEFGLILASESRTKTTQLRRPLDLLKTSYRNMDWIVDAPSFFDLPSECVAEAKSLKPQIKSMINNLKLQIAENQYQRSGGKRNTSYSQDSTISLEGNGILTLAEISRIDSFIRVLEEAPVVDDIALRETAQKLYSSEIDRMFSDGLTFGEATNAPPILNQPEKEFRAALKAIDNDIIEQIKIIEHCLPRWFSMVDWPPPYYAFRIAVILRKAKEHGRERKFLRAYLIKFCSRIGGRTVETLIERASDMGIELPPVR
jgi:hypothetical protein